MKKLWKVIKYIFLIVFLIITLGILALWGYHWHSTSKNYEENKIVSPNGIESLEKVKVGGIHQWIYIRGEDKSKPLILIVHGGPGSPEMPFATRKFQGELEKSFVVVHWDQRETGKSYTGDLPDSKLTIKHFVTDIADLSKLLLKRFKQKKLYIVGHSWGSIIGLLAAKDYPELFYAYVGVGQVADMVKGEQLSYDYVLRKAKEAKDHDAIQDLTAIGRPPYKDPFSDIGIQRQLLWKYQGFMYKNSNPMPFMASAYSSFHGYSFCDATYRFVAGAYTSLQALGHQFLSVSMINRVKEVRIPVYFINGRHDYNTPFELTEKLYQSIKAPKKALIWFEKSGHMANYEEPQKFRDVMVGKVLAETYTR